MVNSNPCGEGVLFLGCCRDVPKRYNPFLEILKPKGWSLKIMMILCGKMSWFLEYATRFSWNVNNYRLYQWFSTFILNLPPSGLAVFDVLLKLLYLTKKVAKITQQPADQRQAKTANFFFTSPQLWPKNLKKVVTYRHRKLTNKGKARHRLIKQIKDDRQLLFLNSCTSLLKAEFRLLTFS